MTDVTDTEEDAGDRRLRRIAQRVAEQEALDEEAATDRPPPPPEPEPCYSDVFSWVDEWFAPVFGRRLGATRWCAEWWRHEEAVFRLEALWRSWEVLRLDAGMGMATWIRDHLDSTRRELLGPDGPFQACDGETASHNPPPPLPVTRRPAGPLSEQGAR